MSTSAAQIAFSLATEISPIILTGGLATAVGGALPIVALTASLPNFIPGSLTALANTLSAGPNFDSFPKFYPESGSTLINQEIARYPFANQTVAANATIAQPLTISMRMLVPTKTSASLPGIPALTLGGVTVQPVALGTGGYAQNLAMMTALQATLAQHNNLGGTYTIVTPKFLYVNCILKLITDVSSGETRQKQYQYKWDFEQPLVSIQAAQTSLNGLMQKLSDGTAISGTPTWSPAGLAVGNPFSLLTSSLVPQTALM